jgi:hypothetical protein
MLIKTLQRKTKVFQREEKLTERTFGVVFLIKTVCGCQAEPKVYNLQHIGLGANVV